MARNPSGDDNVADVAAPFVDMDGDQHFNGNVVFIEASPLDFGEGRLSDLIISGTVAVTIPTIAATNSDSVAVNVASAFTASITVGSFVVAAPLEALPTDCLLSTAYVTATDEITVTFDAKEGGGVTGAAKNFRFLVLKGVVSP